jgi:hypothetical protein
MPKDSHMLPQHSQDLLRAARSGKIYKRPAPVEEEEADPEAIVGDKPEKKDEDLKDKGFMAKAWKQIPRHMEAGDIEYLAKRRKGVITITKNTAPVPTLTKATVKRTDAAGNEYTQDVVVPHGQHVDGEVIAQTVIPAPGVVAPDQFAVQATPPRRKGPVARKKVKGPGRGRKKKAAPPTSVPAGETAGGAPSMTPKTEGAVGPDVSSDQPRPSFLISNVKQGIKIEKDGSATPTQNEDTEMGEGSNAPSDDDEGDEGEYGEEGDDDEGSTDNNASPSKTTRTASPIPAILPTMKPIPNSGGDAAMAGVEIRPFPKILTDHDKLEVKSGSPLKNVALTTSALTSPLASPVIPTPTSSLSAILSSSLQHPPVAASTEIENLDQAMQEETAESAPTELPPPPPGPTVVEEKAAVEMLQEEEEEEDMLLDIVDNIENSNFGAVPAQDPVSEAPSEVILKEEPEVEPVIAELELEPEPEPEPQEQPQSEPPKTEEVPLEPQDEDDDDDFPDLLGGLEKSLDSKPAAFLDSIPADTEKSAEEEKKEGS